MRVKTLSILLVVCFAIPFLSGAQQKLTLENLNNPGLYPAQLRDLQWISTANRYSYIKDNNLMAGDVTKKEDAVILGMDRFNNELEAAGMGLLKRMPSVQWLDEGNFRFMYGKTLATFALQGGKISKVYTLPEDAENIDIESKTLIAAYTVGDNLFVMWPGGKQQQVTFDGGDGIVNGQTVHRNEFGISGGIFWSPKGNLIAFYRKDESMVTQYPLVDTDPRVAEVQNTRYPMAGMTSEVVKVGVYDLQTGKTTFLETGETVDQYLTNITWSPDELSIYIALLNRGQDHMKLNRYSAVTGQPELTLFEEKSSMYVEPENGPLFLPGNPDRFIWQSERNGWNHLYLYDTSGKLLKRYTSGNWMVTRVDGFDKSGNFLYFYSTEISPLESHCYRLDLKKEKITRISGVRGTHRVQPSSDDKYHINQYSNKDEIATRIDLLDQNGKVLKTLLPDKDPLAGYDKVRIVINTLKAEDGTPLYYRMLLPPGFDETRKYPVFYYLYGGPHNQLISDSWLAGAGLFLTYMAQQGYIVFTLDNRGTANRGFEFESVIHRKLGRIEAEDHGKGIAFLLSQPYVDAGRMGIHGWSYGGFMTINIMQTYPGVFKAGVAGGPVVDWKYYEVMYGERYMDTPEENPLGYENASLLTHIDQLQDRLLIIHGSMDDVVVQQHSLSYLKKSVEMKKMVDYFVYPGHGHNVRGNDRIHLFMKVEQYMTDHL